MAEEFKDILRRLRKNRGITQEQLANDLGVPESTIRRYESMHGTPKRERLELFADYFKVTIDFLIGRNGGAIQVVENNESQKEVAKEILQFLEAGFTNEQIMQRINFFGEILKLNDNQADEFMNFVRWQLSTKKEQHSASKADES